MLKSKRKSEKKFEHRGRSVERRISGRCQKNLNEMAERDASRALRFLGEIEDSVLILVGSPYLGSPRFYASPTLHSLRRYQIPSFRNYGIFYRPLASANGIDVWRVLHAKQDDFSQLEEFSTDDSD